MASTLKKVSDTLHSYSIPVFRQRTVFDSSGRRWGMLLSWGAVAELSATGSSLRRRRRRLCRAFFDPQAVLAPVVWLRALGLQRISNHSVQFWYLVKRSDMQLLMMAAMALMLRDEWIAKSWIKHRSMNLLILLRWPGKRKPEDHTRVLTIKMCNVFSKVTVSCLMTTTAVDIIYSKRCVCSGTYETAERLSIGIYFRNSKRWTWCESIHTRACFQHRFAGWL